MAPTDPRRQRSRQRLLDAARALMEEGGPGAVSHQAVAERAGIGRATVYRHWARLEDLLLDALRSFDRSLLHPKDGPIEEWLEREVGRLAREATAPGFAASLLAIIDSASRDAAFDAVRRGIYERSIATLEAGVARAYEQGELGALPDVDVIAAQLIGPILFRAVLHGRDLDADFVASLVGSALAPWRNPLDNRQTLTNVRDMSTAVETVRSFNRTVTERVGALNDHYLARDRSLGEARVIWEIGDEGCEIRLLRARLGLDSGYLSRLLRALEAAGLVAVGPVDADKRVRAAHLTSKGRAERRLLDERSDELAESLLQPLNEAQRQRLVAAMDDVDRLLTAALVEVDVVDPADGRATNCLRRYFSELDTRFDSGFDPDASLPANPDEMRPPEGLFLLASLRGEPVGCGALKFHDRAPTELKRMWVSPAARGLGVGRRLLTELERHAVEYGSRVIRLETNQTLIEAIAMYRSAGYHEVPAFNDEHYAHHWFEKQLTPHQATPAR